jgi:hypothetical protein
MASNKLRATAAAAIVLALCSSANAVSLMTRSPPIDTMEDLLVSAAADYVNKLQDLEDIYSSAFDSIPVRRGVFWIIGQDNQVLVIAGPDKLYGFPLYWKVQSDPPGTLRWTIEKFRERVSGLRGSCSAKFKPLRFGYVETEKPTVETLTRILEWGRKSGLAPLCEGDVLR